MLPSFVIAARFTRLHAVRPSMICQAPIRMFHFIVMAVFLAGRAATPELDHRAVSWRLRSPLAPNSRNLAQQELGGDKVRLEVTILKNGPVSLPMSVRNGVPQVPVRLNGSAPLPFLVDTGSQGCVLEARTAVGRRVTVLDHTAAVTTL